MIKVGISSSIKLKSWEFILILFSFLLFVLAFFLYLSGFPLRNYIFNLSEEEGQSLIGEVAEAQGPLKRQLPKENEFKPIGEKSPLFNSDVLVTGSNSNATLRFENGGSIQMAPNTMVRLSFRSRLSFDGINRHAELEVISGSVTGEAGIHEILIRNGVNLNIIEPHKTRKIEMTVSPPPFIPSIQKPLVRANNRFEVLRPIPSEHSLQTFLPILPTSPTIGTNLSQIVSTAPKKEEASKNIPPLLKTKIKSIGINPLPPLVGGETATSNRVSGKLLRNFDVTFRWIPIPRAGYYEITFFSDPWGRKPLMKKRVEKPSFKFNRDKLFSGDVYYEISAELKNEWIAKSGIRKFSFGVLAPLPVMPARNQLISKALLLKGGDRLLMTWQKTNFTVGYEIEISTDPKFIKPLIKTALKNNYFVLQKPPKGTYWWRVRGYTKDISSPMSEGYGFTIGN